MKRGIAFGIALALAPYQGSTVAHAEVTGKDLQVLGRSLGFVKSAGSSATKFVIVYDPKKPQSAAEAESVLALVGAGLKSGARVLTPAMVKLDDLNGESDVAVYFLTSGLGPDATRVSEIAKAKQIPCATTDIAQVQNGICTVGIKTEPKVEISVNKSAAAAGGITLDDAFKMLIIEL